MMKNGKVIIMLLYGIVNESIIQPIEVEFEEDARLEMKLRFGVGVRVITKEEFEVNYKKQDLEMLPLIK